MCLITTQKEALIASEDITVYKILTEEAKSIYQGFEYQLGKVYNQKIKHSDEWSCLGILDREYLIEKYRKWQSHPDLICLGEGFHSFDSLETAQVVFFNSYSNNKIYKCIIPKGSEFYKDAVGLMISNSLQINEVLNITFRWNHQTGIGEYEITEN